MWRKVALRGFLTAGLIVNLASGTDTTPVPTITIRANTRLVVVDVVVTDKKGQPVSGLRAEDFKLEENGKKQNVAVFVPPGANDLVVTPPPPGIFSNRPENVGAAHIPTVLLLDATNSPFKDQAYARYEMLKYLAEQAEPGRPMAVLALTARLRVLQQFTSDPQILITAIKNFRPQTGILQAGAAAPGSAVPGDVTGPGSGIASAIALAQGEVTNFANHQLDYEIERRTQITIEAMRTLTRMLGGLQGRKNVVWLTAYLPFELIPEDRAISEEQMMADLPGQGRQRSVTVNATGSLAAQRRERHGEEIREAEARLASSNIAIYPVDVRGLVGGGESLASVSTAHIEPHTRLVTIRTTRSGMGNIVTLKSRWREMGQKFAAAKVTLLSILRCSRTQTSNRTLQQP